MIVNRKIKIKLSNKNVGRYKELGYDCESGDIIEIFISELPLQSRQKIKVRCFHCKIEKDIVYSDYNKITSNGETNYYCSKCKQHKTKNTLQKKYGVDNVFQLEEIKEKIKETCLEKYGVTHHLKNKEIQEIQKKTNKQKYGVEYLMQSEEIRGKSRETCLEKYGTDISSKSDKVKENTIKNNLEKYGVEHTSQLENVKEKIKTTKNKNILEKYKEFGIKEIKKNGIYIFNCEKGHDFEISSVLLYNRIKYETILCTKCNPVNSYNISGMQLQLQDFIKENYDNKIIISDRTILKPYELDIYLPELKLAFEFNGVYWHNELNKSNDYHYQKTIKCLEKNIQLIHIYEDDWKYKQDIIKSRILNLLSKSNIIYARKCELKEVNINESRQFLKENHIQGFVGSSVKVGLYYENELVSLMTFGKTRKPLGGKSKNGIYELLRFCNKLNVSVVGGASKLFKYFIKNYKFKEIISYADRSWSKGNLYYKLGFDFVDETKPNYHYVIDGIRRYRFNFRKDILVSEGYDSNKSEHEIMIEREIYRIYDSGNLKFNFNI